MSSWLHLSWDHLLPKGHPDRDDERFIVTACRFCNEAHNRTEFPVEGKTPGEIVAMKKAAIRERRAEYKEFWKAHVRPPASIRSADELRKAVGRVAFSHSEMLYCAQWLGQHRHGCPSWNQHIDSFLIHARKLMDFLDPRVSSHQDDVTTSDFLEDPGRYRVDVDQEFRDQISKRLAHLTHAPVPADLDRVRWPILGQMLPAITTALSGFIADLDRSANAHLAERYRERHAASPPLFQKQAASPGPQTGSVREAIQSTIHEGQVIHTPTRGAPFTVHRIDADGVVLLLGRKKARTPLSWECLESVVPFILDHKGEVEIGGRRDVEPNVGTLDEHVKGCIKRDTAGWVAALLEIAGIVRIIRDRPARVQLIG